MERTCHLLVLSDDASLKAELDAALESITRFDAVARCLADERLALEHARTRRPDLILIESDDATVLTRFADAVSGCRPAPVMIVVCRGGQPTARGDFFIHATRAGVRDFITRPISSTELSQVLDRHTALDARDRDGGRDGRVFSFVSNKGGVGKSTLAVNTAVALARRHPEQVLLVDASLQMGVAASMLDLQPQTSFVDAAEEAERLDASLLRRLAVPHSSGLRLLAAPKDAVEAARIDDAVLSRVLSLGRREFDYVVVDTFPLLDSVAMAIIDLSDTAFVVCTNALPNVIGIQHLLGVLERVGLPASRQRIVLNQTHPSFAGKLSPSDVANQLARDVEAVFPFDRRILTAYNTGDPVAASGSRWFGFAKAIHRFARDLERLDRSAPLPGAEVAS